LPLTEYNFNGENAVDRIFYGRIVVEKAASFLFYSEKGIVKNLIHYLKYRNQPEIGSFLGHWWGQLPAMQSLKGRIDLIVPVPLHPKRERKRGYNQVIPFASALSVHLGVPYLPDALRKTANTKTQTRKNRWYRWQGTQSLYLLNDPAMLQGKRVLLVDDVLTTGATLEACARALQEAGGVRVFIGTMACVP
jgi:ComF family protein